ncbi:MAG: hypothetical protein K2V38_16180, partial [Gemmataceae bacterium]|nr:hypothetical protein [Gemmataceae bacterium]
YTLTAWATDAAGNTALFTRVFTRTATVESDLERPLVSVSVSRTQVSAGEAVQVTVTATDNASVASRDVRLNGVPLALDANGRATFVPSGAGVYTVTATALDPSGNTGSASAEVLAFEPGDTTPPTVVLRDAVAVPSASLPVDIFGTVAADDLMRWVLEISPANRGAWSKLAEGTTPVADGKVGVFDPTLLSNGMYDVRLTALDTAGNTAVAAKAFRATGEAKVGEFTAEYDDLDFTSGGFPITFTRTYDSRDRATVGDFGAGWKLTTGNASASNSSVFGEAWTQVSRPFGDTGTEYSFQNSQNVLVEITLPTGRSEQFIMGYTGIRYFRRPSLPGGGLLGGGLLGGGLGGLGGGSGPRVTGEPLQQTTVFFAPTDPNSRSVLETLDDNVLEVSPAAVGPVEFLDRRTGKPFDPKRWRLSTADGLVYVFNRDTGLESVTSATGEKITIGPDKITHSNGRAVTISRDAVGRVSSVTDLNGKSIRYGYDGYGDLTSVTDREGNVTKYTYDDTHKLVETYDPLGRRARRTEFDAQGRIARVVDAEGNATSLENDLGARTSKVRQPDGGVRTFVYDDRGNVVREIGETGDVTERVFDAANRQTSNTIVLANGTRLTSTYGYDAAGNQTSVTNPEGETTRYTFDARGNPLTTTDPLGRTTTTTYDARGNPTGVTLANGLTQAFTYTGFGETLSATDEAGRVTRFGYSAFGDSEQSVDPFGRVYTSFFDNNGTEIGNVTTWTDPANPSNTQRVITQTVLDANGRVTSDRAADGSVTTAQYDAAGNAVRVTDRFGQAITYLYDPRGNRVEARYVDGTVRRAFYDGAGRGVLVTDAFNPTTGTLPAGTRNLYDSSGRQIGTERLASLDIQIVTIRNGWTEADVVATGSVTARQTQVFDAAGRMTEIRDAAGRVTRYEYDKAGRQTAVIDPLNNRTESEYDDAGQLVLTRDALGRVTRYEYDTMGRQTRVLRPDGLAESVTYTAAGNPDKVTDAGGRVTRYEYNADDALTAVVLPAVPDPLNGNALTNPRTEYDRDSLGNAIRTRDAYGRQTTTAVDEFGHAVGNTSPGGATEVLVYDSAGRLTRSTDADGRVSRVVYDSFGRPTELRLYPTAAAADADTPGVVVVTQYDALGRVGSVTDPRHGVTTYGYDANNRIISVASPEGTVRYAYDPQTGARVETSTDSTTTRYGYDTAGRLVTVTTVKRNGVTLATPEVVTYGYDTIGNRTSLARPNGVTTTYTYDVLDRLTGITDTAADGTVLLATVYTLSATGNHTAMRLARKEPGGAVSVREYAYTYDVLDRLTREEEYAVSGSTRTLTRAQSFVYDLVGNRVSSASTDAAGVTTTTTYEYDADDRLLRSTEGTAVTTYRYDAGGALVERVAPDATTRYTYDLSSRLVRVVTTTTSTSPTVTTSVYGYSASGLRVREAVTVETPGQATRTVTRTFLYDPYNLTGSAQVIEMRSTDPAVGLVSFVIGAEVLAQAGADGRAAYYLTDGLGSTRSLVSDTGTVLAGYDYDAFGNAIGFNPATAAAVLLYTGERLDPATGEYYLRARTYDPKTGRFTSADTFRGTDENPASRNRYTYAENDPVGLTDPSGNAPDRKAQGRWAEKQVRDRYFVPQVKGRGQYWPNKSITRILAESAAKGAFKPGKGGFKAAYEAAAEKLKKLNQVDPAWVAQILADSLLRPDFVTGNGFLWEMKPLTSAELAPLEATLYLKLLRNSGIKPPGAVGNGDWIYGNSGYWRITNPYLGAYPTKKDTIFAWNFGFGTVLWHHLDPLKIALRALKRELRNLVLGSLLPTIVGRTFQVLQTVQNVLQISREVLEVAKGLQNLVKAVQAVRPLLLVADTAPVRPPSGADDYAKL